MNMSEENTTSFDAEQKLKRCPLCGETKPTTEFYRRASRPGSFFSHCRDCKGKKRSAYRQRCQEANAGKDPFDGSMKRCSSCKSHLPRTRDHWTRSPSQKDGLYHYCILCDAVKNSDLLDRIAYLWLNERRKKRTKLSGDWFDHGKAEWLDLIIAQQCRCALTNITLTVDNVSVDHIVPLGKGGTHELSNLRLVTAQVNIALWDGSDEEFFEMCRAATNARLNWLCYGTKENPGGETTGARCVTHDAAP